MVHDTSLFVPPNRDELEGKVSEGFEFLNARYGEEWVDGINLETLDIGNSSLCVGAQLEGSYSEFQEAHAVWGGSSVEMGFDMWWGNTLEREMLNEVWKDKISAARA